MNQELFKITPSLLPKRKVRGLGRYYRQLMSKAENFSIIAEPDHWFNYWHSHIDQNGSSNKSWKNRRKHIQALFAMFHRIVHETNLLEIPFQIWLCLYEKNGYDDAVYLHTPNPHSEFPCRYIDTEWGIENIESAFKELIAPYDIRAGLSYDNEVKQKVYTIYSPSLGKKLESV
ncbi:MAG: hypothetical protein WGN25_18875 [Candidatus Electrothrix sp. GW3-4]|uniref:hypothetical protein n=1 Tax=Candidatus Electrothrix sp. GW3-4 TaxID=3126740 RepID=UPI0030CEAACC